MSLPRDEGNSNGRTVNTWTTADMRCLHTYRLRHGRKVVVRLKHVRSQTEGCLEERPRLQTQSAVSINYSSLLDYIWCIYVYKFIYIYIKAYIYNINIYIVHNIAIKKTLFSTQT